MWEKRNNRVFEHTADVSNKPMNLVFQMFDESKHKSFLYERDSFSFGSAILLQEDGDKEPQVLTEFQDSFVGRKILDYQQSKIDYNNEKPTVFYPPVPDYYCNYQRYL
jgi:GTP-sensing pleiotropic transcriptional regulator CodY